MSPLGSTLGPAWVKHGATWHQVAEPVWKRLRPKLKPTWFRNGRHCWSSSRTAFSLIGVFQSFSQMRSEGFSFYTLGVWGLRCVRWMPLLCSQPSATVRERTFGRKLAVPLGSFTGVVIFGRFTSLQPSFRVAGVALRDMWTCLATC